MTSLNRDLSTSPTALLSLRAMNLSSSASTSPSATRGGGSGGGEGDMSPGRCSGGGSGAPNVTTSSFIKLEPPLSPLDVTSGVVGTGVVGVVGGNGTLSSSSSSGVVSSLDGDAGALVTLGVGGPVLCKWVPFLILPGWVSCFVCVCDCVCYCLTDIFCKEGKT